MRILDAERTRSAHIPVRRDVETVEPLCGFRKADAHARPDHGNRTVTCNRERVPLAYIVTIERWADRIAAWATGTPCATDPDARRAHSAEAHAHPRDVYVYFDNDIKVRAPFDAQALQAKVSERLGFEMPKA